MKAIRKRTFLYISFALCLTMTLMLVKNSDIFDSQPNSLRNLLDANKKNYVCDKAGSRLTDKYKTDFDEDNVDKKSLSKSQQAIIDFARDSSYSNIKPFVKKCAIFIVFIVLDIILVGFWISYCCCCCCKCCLFGEAKPSKVCSCIFFVVALFCYLLIIIFSIIVLALVSSFFKRINGLGCSSFHFLDHVRYGLAPDYSNRVNEWDGLEGVIGKIENTKKIKNDKAIFNKISADSKNIKGTCNLDYDMLKQNASEIERLLDDSFEQLSAGLGDLESLKGDFDDAENDFGDDLYKAMHDHTNKYAIKLYKAIFSLTLIFGILGLGILILFIFFNNTCLKVVYAIIWNISLLLMIFVILEASSFGIIGYIFEDGVQVGNYILSRDNFESNDPLVFSADDDDYISDLVDICVNGDGNFTNVIEGGKKASSNLNNWENRKKIITDASESAKCGASDELTQELRNYYGDLLNVVDQSLNAAKNITDLKCRFAKNDKNILLNEADSAAKSGIALSALGFLIGIFFAISVFCGILFVYKFFATRNENKNINALPNESTTNIEQENPNSTGNANNNTIPYYNNMLQNPNNNMMPNPNKNLRPFPGNNEIYNPK